METNKHSHTQKSDWEIQNMENGTYLFTFTKKKGHKKRCKVNNRRRDVTTDYIFPFHISKQFAEILRV